MSIEITRASGKPAVPPSKWRYLPVYIALYNSALLTYFVIRGLL